MKIHYDQTPIRPCPFCGAKIQNGQWTMTDGFKAVHCSCGAKAPLEKWNKRYNQTAAILDEALNTGDGSYKP